MTLQRTTTAFQYWGLMVVPDMNDLITNRGDLRHAFHAANSLFHMSDWVFHTKRKAEGEFRFQTLVLSDEKQFANALEVLCSDFALIRGVANSAKHLSLRSRRPVQYAPINAANTAIQTGAFQIDAFNNDAFDTDRIVIEGSNDQHREFLEVAKNVMMMWETLRDDQLW
jgi:hypothetical protein